MDSATYQKKLSDHFSSACVQNVLQLAKDVGILDILFSAEQPLTSVEIAKQGNLKERYVREILGALAASEIIHVDSESTKYDIVKDHKEILRVASSYSTLSYLMALKIEVMKDVLHTDGPDGACFDAASFDAIEERRRVTQDSIIEKDILPCIPEVKDQLEKGIHVSEFGCAQGIILLNLAARYPKSTFVGSDISDQCIDRARQLATERGLTNITFEVYDLFELPQTLNNKFDWIFIRDAIHDLPSPVKALKSVKKTLKKGGTASILDFGMQGTLADHVADMYWGRMYSISAFFCIPESYQGQGSDAFGSCWSIEQVRQVFKESGFNLVKEVFSNKTSANVHLVCKV